MKNLEPTAEISGREDAAKTVLTHARRAARRIDIVYIVVYTGEGGDNLSIMNLMMWRRQQSFQKWAGCNERRLKRSQNINKRMQEEIEVNEGTGNGIKQAP